MTVSTELSHEEYTGNGVTTDFDFRFRIFEAKHLVVSVADTDGTERILTNGTDYTLRGVGSYRGGKVILKMPLATGWKIGIARDLPAVQETDLRNQGKFFAEVHEDAFDYLTMLIQKSLGFLSLCLRKPSFISDHYDAKGNKISNLGKPVKDGDAVNLGTMKDHISAKDKRSLRVADKYIPALPDAANRANKLLSFDDDGNPKLVLPESGSAADVLIELGKPDGYKYIPSIQVQQWREQGDIRGWGAVEGEDCSEALQAAINERATKDWGTSAIVVINGSYRIDKQVLIPTDLRLKGNWATITSDMDDYIFISAYVDGSGELVSNWDLSDEDAVATARLKGTTITGITFVDCAKVFKLRNFNERCGMSDLFFERCGVAWFAVSSFYSFFNNIFIRSTKIGYEDWYAFTFGRMTNLVDLFKVSITQRKYGEYYGDKSNNYNNYYELITHRQCSWEHVNRPITIDMKGFSFNIIDWYAEVISGPMIKVESGEQYDMHISRPSWLAGVENMGELKNLKGRSVIYQGSQNDYSPPKPASLFFENSYCEVMTAEKYDYGDRINYTSECLIRYIRPFNEGTTPLTNGEFTTNSHGSVAKNINKKNYISHSSGNVYIKTDIKFTKYNMLIASIDLNYFNCGFLFYGDVFVNKYGYDFSVYSDADGYVQIKIENTGLNDSDQVFLEGCIRYI
ncbi:Phage T7 tail fibre protein [Morganella morganii]|uniref:hypothetical protein n=1 Tax=Morganella morganii TaxID=582 RepID=UPI000D8EFDF8|nr:hypothetical protein [Morganella morganii]SPX92150.1 Phage T7 tail fibre protein [Morganella morganii]